MWRRVPRKAIVRPVQLRDTQPDTKADAEAYSQADTAAAGVLVARLVLLPAQTGLLPARLRHCTVLLRRRPDWQHMSARVLRAEADTGAHSGANPAPHARTADAGATDPSPANTRTANPEDLHCHRFFNVPPV